MEVHHIVEKRFSPQLRYGKTGSNMPSVAISKEAHREYTNKWREALRYGETHSKKRVLETSISIYKNNPRMLGAAIFTITRG